MKKRAIKSKKENRQELFKAVSVAENSCKQIFEIAMKIEATSQLLKISGQSAKAHQEIFIGLGYALAGIKEELTDLYVDLVSQRHSLEKYSEDKKSAQNVRLV